MAKKLFIYPKDIQRIAGFGYSYAAKVHKAIREELDCGKNLTLKQYCEYAGLPENEIRDFLQGDTHHPGLDIS